MLISLFCTRLNTRVSLSLSVIQVVGVVLKNHTPVLKKAISQAPKEFRRPIPNLNTVIHVDVSNSFH